MTPKDSKTQASSDKVASRNASNTKQRSCIRRLLPPHFFKGLCHSKICPVYTHLENPKGKKLKSPSPNANAGHPWPHFELRSLDRGRKRISMELNKNNLCRLENLAAAEQKKMDQRSSRKKIDRVKFFLRRKKRPKRPKKDFVTIFRSLVNSQSTTRYSWNKLRLWW